jgi:hypothetical protein
MRGLIAARAVTDPEALLGTPAQMLLTTSGGRLLTVRGWTLGTGRADVRHDPVGTTRTVMMEIVLTEAQEYVIGERVETIVADGARRLAATVTTFRTARELVRYVESGSCDPSRDGVLVTALDHAARSWPSLSRVLARGGGGRFPAPPAP